jgi:hypothetical protein
MDRRYNQRNYTKEVESIQKQSIFQDKYRTLYSNNNTLHKIIKDYYYGN